MWPVLQLPDVNMVAVVCLSALITVCERFMAFHCCCGMISTCYRCDSQNTQSALPGAHRQWGFDYESGSDSDTDRPDPDLVLDDLASRRFRSPSPAPPTNFSVPIGPSAGERETLGKERPRSKVTITPSATHQKNVTFSRSEIIKMPCDVPVWWELLTLSLHG